MGRIEGSLTPSKPGTLPLARRLSDQLGYSRVKGTLT
ncbi:MAG: hypothetical protein ACI802_002298 [Candidatus Paceibacteria bacterium]|jgi:hypothetical protein